MHLHNLTETSAATPCSPPYHHRCRLALTGISMSLECLKLFRDRKTWFKTRPSNITVQSQLATTVMNLLSVNRLVEIILNCGERYEACAAEQVLSLDSQDSATDILSNLYAAAGKWDSAVDMKRKNRVLNSKKDPGLNGTESEQEVGR
ncbi:hypothetical protein PS1_018859 [Malus domestica]